MLYLFNLHSLFNNVFIQVFFIHYDDLYHTPFTLLYVVHLGNFIVN